MSPYSEKKRGRCLVLGGCGFMGSHIVDGLIESGYQVRIFDKVNVDTRNISHLIHSVELMEGDFIDEVALARAVKEIDYIFHFIGTTLPKSSTDNPVYDVQSNVVSTLKLFDLALKEKIKKIIFASSGGTVYGAPQSIPIPEDHPTNPTSSYGISKLTIEKYLNLYRITKGLDYLCFRISNPYGERQNPHAIQGAVAVFLGLVMAGKPITIWGNGDITRDYIYVKDVVSVPISALQMKNRWNVFNLGSGNGTTLNELVTIIRDVTQRAIEVNYTEGRAIDVPVNVLDISRAREDFNFAPRVHLREGIRRTWEWLNQGAENK
jgi:UDP-glucose 4-epimerase